MGLEGEQGNESTRAIFYDWGDSVIAHPLGSASVPISRVRKIVGLSPSDRDTLRMRDAYLEVFTDAATHSDLRAAFDASCRLARATRAIVWGGSVEDISLYLDELDHGFGGW